MLFEPWLDATSQTKSEFWKRVATEFDEACTTLQSVRYETEEEARNKRYASALDPTTLRADTLFVHRFRRTDDSANILYYWQMGYSLLEKIAKLIDERCLTSEFVSCWGKLMFCVGFVSAGQFATGNDAGHLRAGKHGGEAVSLKAHRRWFAHYFLRSYEGRGKRTDAETKVQTLINAIIDGSIPGQFDVLWFEKFLDLDVPTSPDNYAKLRKPFRELSVARMRGLVNEDPSGLPSLDLNFPTP